MLVSVIIPVYNAARFVTRAVESALEQPETSEVILIEDGSPDNTLKVCQELAVKYDRVELLRHPNGENRGAGASRNLGMKNANYEYIAFLDADDYYLPGRFSVAKQIFESDPPCEGVYEAIGMHVEDEIGMPRWIQAGKPNKALYTITRNVEPRELGSILISGKYGNYHLNGLVLKKDVLKKSGYMIESLKLHQDSEFMIRVAIVARLLAGRLDEPVAMRRVHNENRISEPRSETQKYKERMSFWMNLYYWSKENSNADIQGKILNGIVRYSRNHKYFKKFPIRYFPTILVWFVRLLRLVGYPEVIFDLIKGQKAE